MTLAVGSIVVVISDLALGIFLEIKGLCCPNAEETAKYSDKAIFDIYKLLNLPYKYILKTLNPHAKVKSPSFNLSLPSPTLKIEKFLVQKIFLPLIDKAEQCSQEEGFKKRHIDSRLTYASLLITQMVVNIIRTAMGTVAVAISLLTFGCFKEVNEFALGQFKNILLLKNPYIYIRRMINPQTQYGSDHIKGQHNFCVYMDQQERAAANKD